MHFCPFTGCFLLRYINQSSLYKPCFIFGLAFLSHANPYFAHPFGLPLPLLTPLMTDNLVWIPVADLRDQLVFDATELELTLYIFSITALGAVTASHF